MIDDVENLEQEPQRMNVEVTVHETDVYDTMPQFQWRKYQKGMLGILNNAYNQSCNCGTKVLGNMSEITSEFDGGSYQDFLDFYYDEHDGKERRRRAVKRMAQNLIDRIESVGGELDENDAVEWSKRYITLMVWNSYQGFMDEERAIELVADEAGEDHTVAPPSEESDGIDGYIGEKSVQVKPETHTSLDINSYDTDLLITYSYDDGTFTVTCE